jgi:hypothetical protein
MGWTFIIREVGVSGGMGSVVGVTFGVEGVWMSVAAEDAAGCGEGRRHTEDPGLWIWEWMVRDGSVTVEVCFVLPVEDVRPLYFRGEAVHY